jgi:hypothetical protein
MYFNYHIKINRINIKALIKIKIYIIHIITQIYIKIKIIHY